MKSYSASNENTGGRLTHKGFQTKYQVGAEGPHRAMTVLDLLRHGEASLISRTKTGKNFRVPEGFTNILGIDPTSGKGHVTPPGTELVAVHDMLTGLYEYVGNTALSPQEIVLDIKARLEA